jgi:hypothetical protein
MQDEAKNTNLLEFAAIIENDVDPDYATCIIWDSSGNGCVTMRPVLAAEIC